VFTVFVLSRSTSLCTPLNLAVAVGVAPDSLGMQVFQEQKPVGYGD
jgi:hypothetical protein